MKSVTCRYCAEKFTPLPGKPGYINECPECLHEKTAPLTRAPLSAGSAKQRKLREEARRALAALGAPAEEIEKLLDSIPSTQR
jgi:hypothetical protein